MKQQSNYSVTKAVSRYLRRIRFTARGNTLSSDAQNYCLFVFRCWYSLLSDHLPQTSLRHFVNNTDDVDVAVFGLYLKRFSTAIRCYANGFEVDGRLTLREFEVTVCQPKGYAWLTCLRPLLEEFLFLPTSETLRVLLQLIDFPTRANVEGVITEEELLGEYMDLEDNYPIAELDILDNINGLIPDVRLEDVLPSHGPGAVAEGTRSRIDKEYLLASRDLRLEYLYKMLNLIPPSESIPLDRCSKLIFVPKSLWTYRTISAEPAVLQFWQHGVAHSLERMFSRCWIGHHIKLRDQEHSQTLCREGSWFGDYDTIDLSEASDRVSWEHVKSLTKNCPNLRRLLAATRSDETLLPNGNRVKLKKFAPMGSACAFPMESLFFCCVCEIAVMKVAGRRSYSNEYCVYGDDIVIRSKYTQELLELLDRLGSKVNTQKSFFNTCLMNFREACGVEYFNGDDVTPLRFPRFIDISWKRWQESAGPIIGLLDFRNAAYCRGFHNLAACIQTELRDLPLSYVRRIAEEDWQGGLVLATKQEWATNYQLETRYNEDYQSLEYRCLRVRSRSSSKLEGYLGLQSWFHGCTRAPQALQSDRRQSYPDWESVLREPNHGSSDPEVSILTIGWDA